VLGEHEGTWAAPLRALEGITLDVSNFSGWPPALENVLGAGGAALEACFREVYLD
jgi:hypothetical protein